MDNGCFLHTFPVFRRLTNLSACIHFAASTIIIVSSTILTVPVYVYCLTQDLNITIQLAYFSIAESWQVYSCLGEQYWYSRRTLSQGLNS